jgi:hypothetical protein
MLFLFTFLLPIISQSLCNNDETDLYFYRQSNQVVHKVDFDLFVESNPHVIYFLMGFSLLLFLIFTLVMCHKIGFFKPSRVHRDRLPDEEDPYIGDGDLYEL